MLGLFEGLLCQLLASTKGKVQYFRIVNINYNMLHTHKLIKLFLFCGQLHLSVLMTDGHKWYSGPYGMQVIRSGSAMCKDNIWAYKSVSVCTHICINICIDDKKLYYSIFTNTV